MAILLTGNSIFSLILAKNLIKNNCISQVFISRSISSSVDKILKVYKKTSFNYFCYRTFIELISKFLPNLSVENYLRNKKIFYENIYKLSNNFKNILNGQLIVLCNFDMLIPKEIIKNSKKGLINIHASDLPADKGISPFVWAYCRGDESVSCSFYLVDEGIDTGKVFHKFVFPIKPNTSLFFNYLFLLKRASKELIEFVKKFDQGFYNKIDIEEENKRYTNGITPNYNSWPNQELNKLMKKNSRNYFNFSDLKIILQLIFNKI